MRKGRGNNTRDVSDFVDFRERRERVLISVLAASYGIGHCRMHGSLWACNGCVFRTAGDGWAGGKRVCSGSATGRRGNSRSTLWDIGTMLVS